LKARGIVTYTIRLKDGNGNYWEIVRHVNARDPQVVQTNILTLKKAEAAQMLWRARERGDA